MSQLSFKMGKVGDSPEILAIVNAYYDDLENQRIPTTWPKSEHIHQASLFYEQQAISILMFAPIQLERDLDEHNIYIAGAYTVPRWRRRGIYGRLLALMIDRWRLDSEYDWLKSGFHLDNQVSREMQMRQNREFYEVRNGYQRTRLSLRPTGLERDITSESLAPILESLER